MWAAPILRSSSHNALSILGDETPLPPEAATLEEDDKLFEDEPWISPPIATDYGYNVKLGKGVYINRNSVFLDTCLTTIGDRTLVGPNVSFFSAAHPLDPAVRNGLRGPELGKEIHVEEDCWIGGNVVILPGVTIGKGSTGKYGCDGLHMRLLLTWHPVVSWCGQRGDKECSSIHRSGGEPSKDY
jgi:hypothetical protein